MSVREWLHEHRELVRAAAGVVLLGVAAGWLVVWLGSGGGGG